MGVRFASLAFMGVCHGGFCCCFRFFSRRGRGRPAAVLRLCLGPAGFAWRGRVVSGAGLPVRAVFVVRAGVGLRALGFGAGLAGVGAPRLRRFPGLVGLRAAGPAVRGQGCLAFRLVLLGRPRGPTADPGAVLAGGARCLGCPGSSRWPVRGVCPRPAPHWSHGWRRIWPGGALRSSSAAAAAPMRRCCRRFPVRCRLRWSAAWPRSVPAASVPARFRRWGRWPSSPRPAVRCGGGRAVRFLSRFGFAWPIAPGRWSVWPMPGWSCSSPRPSRAGRFWLAATRCNAGFRCWRSRSVFRPIACRFWGPVRGFLRGLSAGIFGPEINRIFLHKYLYLLNFLLKYKYIDNLLKSISRFFSARLGHAKNGESSKQLSG